MPLLTKRPSAFALLTTAAVVVVGGYLGVWQLQRRAEKHDLIDRIEGAMTGEPAALPAWVDEPEAWDYRRVKVTGTFRHDQESYLQTISRARKFGYQVITPMERPGVGTVLINRGWVPPDKRDPATRPEGQITGMTTVEGIVRTPWERAPIAARVLPADEAEPNVFYEAALDDMALAHGISVLPVFVDAGDVPNPGGLPLGGQTVLKVNDPHLSYAMQWFGLALAAFVIFVLYHRRKDG